MTDPRHERSLRWAELVGKKLQGDKKYMSAAAEITRLSNQMDLIFAMAENARIEMDQIGIKLVGSKAYGAYVKNGIFGSVMYPYPTEEELRRFEEGIGTDVRGKE
jgi:hypothetical protein